MENKIKRFLSLVVALVMVFGMLPMGVFAAEDNTITGKITEDAVWNDGDVIGGVTIAGNVTITVNGTVSVAGTIRLNPDAICNVTFKGENNATLIRDANFTGQMFYAEGVSGNFQNLTFNNINLDGGADWNGDVDKTLNRGTVNEGVKATGSVLYLVYANAKLNISTLQNHDDSTGEKANAVFLRYYSTIEFNNSVVRDNYSISDYYSGGVVTVRQGGTVKTNNTEVCGNAGPQGGFFGVGSTGSYGGICEVYNSKFHNNYSDAGAVFDMQCNSKIGYLLIEDCEFYDNASARGLIYEHAYSRPVIIKDSTFRNNECAVWDCHTDPILDISGKFVVEEDADYTNYLYETALGIGGALSDGAVIPISDASYAKLMTNSGRLMTEVPTDNYYNPTSKYTILPSDMAKMVWNNPDGLVLIKTDIDGVDGTNRGLDCGGMLDVVPAVAATTTNVTIHENFKGSTLFETQAVSDVVKNIPIAVWFHEGFYFTGWAVTANGAITYSNKSNAATYAEGTDLYATWKLQTPEPVISIKVPADANCKTLVVALNNWGKDVDNYTYQWQKDGVDIEGATGTEYTYTESGKYTCKVTASAEGFESTTGSASKTVTIPVNYVAQVVETGVKYESLKEAIEACTNGETVKLLTDITYGEDDVVTAIGGATGYGNYPNPSIIYIGGTKGATDAENQPSNVNAILDLNGFDIVNNADAYLFLLMDNAKLTFKDSVGGSKVETTTEAPVLWVTGTETLVTIESGEYITACSEGLLHCTHAGDLVITGGEFRTTAKDASLLIVRNNTLFNNPNYFLEGQATVTVTGGVYYGFDPEHTFDDSNNTLTEFNAVAEGYESIYNPANNSWFIVDDYVEWIKAELLAGRDVSLLRDIVVDASYIDSIPASTNGNGKYPNYAIFNVIGDEVTFDLNGHTITYNGHEDFEWNGKTYNSCAVAHGLFYANDHADLTIIDSSEEQTGTVLVHGLASGAYVASPDTKLTITGGTWRNDGCAECGGMNIFLYPLQGGELYITGGFFEQALDTAGDSYLMVEHGGEYANSVIDYAKTKIEITGGTFAGMNPEQALYFQQTADNKLVMGEITNVVANGYFAIETSDENNAFIEGNTWTVVDVVSAGYVAYNVQNDAYFKDLSDALDAANSGEIVQLLKYWEEDLVLVPAGVTFDLNGNVVKAGNVLSFGDIVDQQTKVGGIEIPIETTKAFTKLQPGNTYLPIYDSENGMYKFFAYEVESSGIVEGSNQVTFAARILFTNPAAYQLLIDSEKTGMDFVMTMSWTGVTSFGVRYTISEKTMKDFAAVARDALNDGTTTTKAIALTVKGLDKLGDGAFVSATPSVVTIAEVTDSSDIMTHKIP